MSNGNFQHEPSDDELLSAYVDGELSAEERAAVEARLATDADSQQLVHQLRAVSQQVQMLPLEPAPHDLRAEILRRVAASQANQSTAPAEQVVTPAAARNAGSTLRTSRRPWIWATLALAAGLLIMVMVRPPGSRDGEVAVYTTEGKVGDQSRLADATKPATEDGRSLADPGALAQHDRSYANESTTSPSPTSPAVASRERRVDAATDRFAGTLNSNSDALPPLGDVNGKEPAKSEPYGVAMNSPATTPGPADQPAPAAAGPPGAEFRGGGGVSSGPATVGGGGGFGGVAGSPQQVPGPITPTTPSPVAPETGALAQGQRPTPEGEKLKVAVNGGNRAPELAVPPTASPAAPPAPVAAPDLSGVLSDSLPPDEKKPKDMLAKDERQPIVVQLNVRPGAIQDKRFEKLLAASGIDFQAEAELQDKKSLSGNESPRKIELSSEAAKSVAKSTDSLSHQDASRKGSVTVVLVDAPTPAIESCLAALQADQQNFASLEVKQSTEFDRVAGATTRQLSSTELGLSRYNRPSAVANEKRQSEATISSADSKLKSDEAAKSPANFGRDKGLAESDKAGGERATQENKSIVARGRARLIVPQQLAKDLGVSSDFDFSKGRVDTPVAGNRGEFRGQLAQKAARREPNERLKVYFIIRPEDSPATTAPAQKAAQ